jgi:hypothetical protein
VFLSLGARKLTQSEKQLQAWQDDLTARLKGKETVPKYWEVPELERGFAHSHCAYCFDINCKRTLNSSEAGIDACDLTICNFECGAIYHSCKASEHRMICQKYKETDAFDMMYKTMIQGSQRAVDVFQARQQRKMNQEKKKAEPKKSIGDLFFGPGDAASKLNYHKVNGKPVPNAPDLPKKENFLNSLVRLDMRLETETRLQTKPKSMYTFVCAQQFRRDEYGWHSKNVHDEILGGMNNWLEQRCPMASYGCGFSMRRMYPNFNDKEGDNFIPKSTIVFSPGVESFGIAPLETIATRQKPVKKKMQKTQSTPKKETLSPKSSRTLHLTDLPYEILYQITEHLESFR